MTKFKNGSIVVLKDRTDKYSLRKVRVLNHSNANYYYVEILEHAKIDTFRRPEKPLYSIWFHPEDYKVEDYGFKRDLEDLLDG